MIKNLLILLVVFFASMATASSVMDVFSSKEDLEKDHYIENKDAITLTKKNTVIMRGQVNPSSVAKWSVDLADRIVKRSEGEVVYLVIDSGGGSVDAGQSFIEFAKKFKNVETITLYGASMASAIAMAIPGKRHAVADSSFMFHRAFATLRGQVETGELEKRLAMVQKLVLSMEQSNADRIGISLEKYKKNVINEWWLNADQSIEEGVADVITDVRCSADLLKSRVKETVRSMFGSSQITYSACPLIRYPLN